MSNSWLSRQGCSISKVQGCINPPPFPLPRFFIYSSSPGGAPLISLSYLQTCWYGLSCIIIQKLNHYCSLGGSYRHAPCNQPILLRLEYIVIFGTVKFVNSLVCPLEKCMVYLQVLLSLLLVKMIHGTRGHQVWVRLKGETCQFFIGVSFMRSQETA